MEKWTTNNCTIYQILKGRSNSFLVNQENNYILIDTGRENSWKELTSKIDELLGENELSCLILTHTHFDHAENANRLKKKYNCKIIIHESEADNLKQGDTPLPKGTNLATGFLVDVLGKKMQSRYKYEPADHDILVGEKIDLSVFGFNKYIIHTPGHSQGSMSIIIDDEIAIVGDTMFGMFGNSIFPPFADDTEIMIKSWKKLLETNCKLFLPGHGKGISRELLEKQYSKHKNVIISNPI
jgi:glyoxylase-like metal-dependent hydrolase (beta-lactamase superfamily II)